MNDRMTLTDIARHIDRSRPTAYKIVRSRGFPSPGIDKRYDRSAVLKWLETNSLDTDAAVVGGVLVRSVDA